ncbi:MAG: hypothetical protein LWY06_19370, partial [Firmicutes bacterium]|nr:hypothetical protein [Bacillota bacterium]
MSDLKASSGFFLQIFLHKGLHYENDDRSMCEKAGVLKYLNVFVSSIAPVYYYSLTLMHKNDLNNNDSYCFENHYPPFE